MARQHDGPFGAPFLPSLDAGLGTFEAISLTQMLGNDGTDRSTIYSPIETVELSGATQDDEADPL